MINTHLGDGMLFLWSSAKWKTTAPGFSEVIWKKIVTIYYIKLSPVFFGYKTRALYPCSEPSERQEICALGEINLDYDLLKAVFTKIRDSSSLTMIGLLVSIVINQISLLDAEFVSVGKYCLIVIRIYDRP